MTRRVVALFDFDGTLTRSDSLMPFLRFVAGTPCFAANTLLLSPVLAAHAARALRNDIAKQIVLARFLHGRPMEMINEAGRRFAAAPMTRLLDPPGMERLRWHLDQGHDCVLVSASLDVYLAPWAQANGFTHWITSALARDAANRATGRLLGANCHGEEKARRVRAFLASRAPYDESHAYGDSRSDEPVLRLATQGWWRNRGGRGLCPWTRLEGPGPQLGPAAERQDRP